MPVAELFKALGEPTRLQMVEKLSNGRSYTITSLSLGLKLSRQGVRKHLQILEEAEIITLIKKGRNTTVTLDEKTLDIGQKFIQKLTIRWENRLEALRKFVDKK